MDIGNKTEEQYKEVARLLTEIGLKPVPRVLIMANIVGICTDISKRMSSEDIVRKYDLKIKPDSFTGMFKLTTGVSIKDIPAIMYKERRRIKSEQIRAVVNLSDEAMDKLFDVLGIEEDPEWFGKTE